jgi:CRP-like cAMP-binding protein
MSSPELPCTSAACPNRLLRLLPPHSWQRLHSQLDWVDLPLGAVLYDSGAASTHVYFPTTAIVSLLCELADGGAVEIAVVGSEGVVGVALLLGGDAAPGRAVVHGKGRALRLPALALQQEFEQGGAPMHLLLRYIQTLIAQMAQTAVCNRHHSLEQQLCRLLLLSLDRLQGDELMMTQELIANRLGVRREGVTEAAGRLQKAGLIRYSRGHIRVLDRAALEAQVCECYGVVRRELERLLPDCSG